MANYVWAKRTSWVRKTSPSDKFNLVHSNRYVGTNLHERMKDSIYSNFWLYETEPPQEQKADENVNEPSRMNILLRKYHYWHPKLPRNDVWFNTPLIAIRGQHCITLCS